MEEDENGIGSERYGCLVFRPGRCPTTICAFEPEGDARENDRLARVVGDMGWMDVFMLMQSSIPGNRHRHMKRGHALLFDMMYPGNPAQIQRSEAGGCRRELARQKQPNTPRSRSISCQFLAFNSH